MPIKELGHAVLYVHNVERSAHFYRDILGFTETSPSSNERLPIALFSSGRTHHELLLIEVGDQAQEIPRGRRVGLYHLGFKVGDSDDELRAMLDQIRSHNVTIVGMSDHTVTHSVYVLDPDGNELELYIDVPGVDWRTDPTVVMAPIRPLFL